MPPKKKIKQGGVQLPNSTDLNWRVKPEDSLSDWTIQVIVEGSEEEKTTYHVHRNILSLGKVRSDYFRAIFHTNIALQEKETSTSVLRLPSAQANSVPCLLDHFYGLVDDKVNNKEMGFKSVDELIDLLSLADYLQTKGLDHVLATEFKHRGYNDREYGQFLFMYEEKLKGFGFRKETDSVVASKMNELITRGKFEDPKDCPVLPPEFLSQILRKTSLTFDLILHLQFITRIMAQQKVSLPEDFFETAFDEGFRISIKSGTNAKNLIRISLLLLNLEYHVGCQLTPLKKWCRECLRGGFLGYCLKEDPDEGNPCQLLLEFFDYDRGSLLKCTEKIPSSVILELMLE